MYLEVVFLEFDFNPRFILGEICCDWGYGVGTGHSGPALAFPGRETPGELVPLFPTFFLEI